MKYELAIFDMDGTILDTLEDLTDSLNYALSLSKYPTRTLDEVRSFVGNGLRKLIERATPSGTSKEALEKVFIDFTSYYPNHCFDKTKPYTGIIEVIQTLRNKGIKTAVVSNKANYAVQILCKQYFDGLFDFAVGEQEGVQKKPAPDSVNLVIDKLNAKYSDCVYIGDSDVDIQTAANAKIDCISVTWGFRDVNFLKEQGADIIVSAPEELLFLLL